MKTIKKIIKVTLYILLFIFVIINSSIIIDRYVLKKDYPNVFGYTFFEIASNSMYPELQKGDIVLIKLNQNYKTGDIITYWDTNFYTTHRLVEIKENTYITKGDNNNTTDSPIEKNKVIGKMVLKIKKAGYLIYLIKQPVTVVLIFITIILLCFRKKL